MPDFVTIATYDDYVIANLDLQLLQANEVHSKRSYRCYFCGHRWKE